MFFLKKNDQQALSLQEKQRLGALPRYLQTETLLFGTKIIINDACTLLCDIDEIIEREIYRFHAESQAPIIIDCGSNIGISIIYFKRLYENAKIIAFEADPVLFDMLSRNISNFKYKNISLHHSAIWVNNSGVNFLCEGGHSGRISESECKENNISISSRRLREILEGFERIDMLKLDIEGAESDVIFDCNERLKKCNHIFVEYHSKASKKQDLHNLLKCFSDFGYRYHIHESFTRKKPFVDNNCMIDMDLQLNLFFYKK